MITVTLANLKRLQQPYNTIQIMAIFLSCVSTFLLSFDTPREEASLRMLDVSAGLPTSAAMTAVVALAIIAMLSFHFRRGDTTGRYDGAVVWLPVILIDIVIIEFLVGLGVRHSAKPGFWPGPIMGCELDIMITISLLVAFYVWRAGNDQEVDEVTITTARESKVRVE